MKKRAHIAIATIIIFYTVLYAYGGSFEHAYAELRGRRVVDRYGLPVAFEKDSMGAFVFPIPNVPQVLSSELIHVEDKHFYYHPGVDPFALVRALFSHGKSGGSTITMQLAKQLLGNTNERTFTNKIHEIIAAIGLTARYSKEEILTMYANTAPLGNNITGFGAASYSYFGKDLSKLDDDENALLVNTLRSPDSHNPRKSKGSRDIVAPVEDRFVKPTVGFEVLPLIKKDTDTQTTIDANLTERLRGILSDAIDENRDRGMENGSIIVIKVPENQILAIVGSPDPHARDAGAAIDMSREPRAIGSTLKPFIFLESISKGIRPYTLVEDKEYKFNTEGGEAFYPKNYDGKYRGTVTVADSITNSYNTPFIALLDHIGIDNFLASLSKKYHLKPAQEMSTYQYGVALGALELDPLSLAHLYTLFPDGGLLAPLTIEANTPVNTRINIEKAEQVTPKENAALVTATLEETIRGVEQFGTNGNTHLLGSTHYAVKTGTSHDYHDSWVVGYTGDYVVLVWAGNARNKAMQEVSGSSGAGGIWHKAMDLMANSVYNKHTPLPLSDITHVTYNGDEFPALNGDKKEFRTTLASEDDDIIVGLHDGDEFMLGSEIPLKSTTPARWTIDDMPLDVNKAFFKPTHTGSYRIRATTDSSSQLITIHISLK